MIIDSHAYCFESADSAAGHASGIEHLKWVQRSHAGHHQPATRIRDRTGGSSQVLNPSGGRDPKDLPDLNFRVNHACGRVVWDYQGEEYTKYFYPPALSSLEYTEFLLTCEMDHADVDAVLLHTDPMLGRDNDFQSACVTRFAGRIYSMSPVDEWRIPTESDSVIAELERAVGELGLHAIKFAPPHAYAATDAAWDDGPFRAFWRAASALDVPVFFTLGTGQLENKGSAATVAAQRRGYIGELQMLRRWMDRYPDTVCALTHGFPWRLFLEGDRIVLPEELWEPFTSPNCNIEVCFPVRIGDIFDYPYREVWPVLEEMVERVGADHLHWGTDMPFQNRFCTYWQSRKWIEEYCDFLKPVDLQLIMGGTVARILGIPSGDSVG